MKSKFIIIIIITILFIIFFKKDIGPITLDNDKLLYTIYTVLVLSALIIAIFNSKTPFKQLIKAAGAWVIIIGVLLIGFSYKSELVRIYNRVYANLIPGNYVKDNKKTVIVYANQYGHYYVNSITQGANIKYLIDTGATTVSLTRADAEKIGIDINKLNYTQKVSTANGIVLSAPVKLDYIQINDIIVEDIRASVSQDNGLEKSLLGMSFLNKLNSFEVSDDSLKMIGE
ncbi:retropepsin-like aspartic protease family protein [Candidatus Aquarickettsia rohweri]|uniref:TIGR02281 family clan AA aspartic protease n=1 Tax=Candidatus Aquarickettsia rohweri TaxID=2602574 RepID=A0A3R9XL24_9RICK|nr:TIGR02281 family clan AA aspartic protease [Candidatus Aquarickettsia rohweri]RST64121.1 TIGR02281 family clan AA aspartic protease [Candidatus Aquarickettsia rohweri]